MNKSHVWHNCNDPECFVCRGGLKKCEVCGQAEGDLQPICPGKVIHVYPPEKENDPTCRRCGLEKIFCLCPVNKEFNIRDTGVDSVQYVVDTWLHECMGKEVANNLEERAWRVAEEACELLHAVGMPLEDLVIMAMQTYKKNEGKTNYVATEMADLHICLAAMATAYGVNLEGISHYVNERNWDRIEELRKKHAAKELRSKAEVAAPKE